MRNELLKNQKKDSLCEIYTNYDNPGKFAVGFITSVGDEHFLFEPIDEFGKIWGPTCQRIDVVFKIKTGSKYLAKIQQLLNFNNQKRSSLVFDSENLLFDFLGYLCKKKEVCEISLCEGQLCDEIGFIVEFSESVVNVKSLNDFGDVDGVSTISLDEINYIEYASDVTKRATILFNSNQ